VKDVPTHGRGVGLGGLHKVLSSPNHCMKMNEGSIEEKLLGLCSVSPANS